MSRSNPTPSHSHARSFKVVPATVEEVPEGEDDEVEVELEYQGSPETDRGFHTAVDSAVDLEEYAAQIRESTLREHRLELERLRASFRQELATVYAQIDSLSRQGESVSVLRSDANREIQPDDHVYVVREPRDERDFDQGSRDRQTPLDRSTGEATFPQEDVESNTVPSYGPAVDRAYVEEIPDEQPGEDPFDLEDMYAPDSEPEPTGLPRRPGESRRDYQRRKEAYAILLRAA